MPSRTSQPALPAEPAGLQRPDDHVARCSGLSSTRLSSKSSPTKRRSDGGLVRGASRRATRQIDADTRPNDLIATHRRRPACSIQAMPLLDEYDVYEQLMTYWHDTMHDDVFLIMNDRQWVWAAAKPRQTIEDKERKLSENADLEVGSGRAKKYQDGPHPTEPHCGSL